MSFDLAALSDAVARHGRVVRIVVAEVAGSAPREVGAAMLVWADGQSGSIGGGALEYQAVARARQQLPGDRTARLDRLPLGPALGQCCGGSVTLLSEVYDSKALTSLHDLPVYARRIDGGDTPPLAVTRRIARSRSQGRLPAPGLTGGWMIEPVATPAQPLWIYGAGHVGRALVATLAPLPDFAITWVDTGPERFPDAPPEGVTALPAARPDRAVRLAPQNAHHLILTYSHVLDLNLCHALLAHGFASAGLIGSKTKWARFRSRLQKLGHSPGRIDRITCPIGTPGLGKHPQAIAIGVAAAMLGAAADTKINRGTPGDRDQTDRVRAADA